VGSAQVRRKGVVLQHGALPLRGDVGRLSEVLRLAAGARQALGEKLRQRAIALDEALERDVTWEEAADALAGGFAEALDLALVPGDLSSFELAQATRLQRRYASDEWSLGR
jgi:lipoate-protein ligase A